MYYRALTIEGGELTSKIHIASVPNGKEPGSGGTFGNGDANDPAISAEGRVIAFNSQATNYGTTTPGSQEVWERDTKLETTTLASREGGESGPAVSGVNAFPPSISSDGSLIGFSSNSSSLDPDGVTANLAYVRVLPPTEQPPTPGTPALAPLPPRSGVPETCEPGVWTGEPSFTYDGSSTGRRSREPALRLHAHPGRDRS